jgi:hypothetical protein
MMREHGGKTYRPWKPERYQQGAYSPAAKLPEGDLIFFLLETVPGLDLSRFLLPGLKKIRGEWLLVCLTHNLLKIWRYGWAQKAA